MADPTPGHPSRRTRSWWGWGWAESALSDAECRQLAPLLAGLSPEPRPAPQLERIHLPPSRLSPPTTLAATFSADPADRASHTYGKAYRDLVRALSGDFRNAPDLVAFPRHDQDVVDVLDWASDARVAVVPYGGGSSVVGGVECRDRQGCRGAVSLDLTGLDQVLEVDPLSQAARIQAGVLGPALEAQLSAHELTLRHFPQSFEFSTLGGWLATHAGGHYATLRTRIDDFTESLRAVTPIGVSESWRLPASGAGPLPDRLFLGSEGAFGVITEAWLRVQRRPRLTASAAVRFSSFCDGVTAVREVAQSGLHPANCRLLDAGEAALSGAASHGESVLLLGFESATCPVDGLLAQAVEIAAGAGGTLVSKAGPASGVTGPIQSWRAAFLRMPYLRDGLARLSGIVETFETACVWGTVPPLHEAVRAELAPTIAQICGAPGMVNCRLTHVYPDGAAPYFTVIAPGRRGSELAMWDEIKRAASEILHRHGATITHHHAVGRDHRPWYDRQRPQPYAQALRAAKQALDPAGILNPGVLVG